MPRKELARQLGKTLTKYGLQHGFIASGTKPNPFAPVQVALTESLARRLDKAHKSDLLITDECHVGGESLTSIRTLGRRQVRSSSVYQPHLDAWTERDGYLV